MKKALLVNVILTFILIVLGGTVRNFDAGLACPDWPLCHGKIIPPLDLEVFLEWFHRLVASIVGFITLGICVVALWKKDYRKLFGFLSFIALLLVIFQAILGGMTVLDLLAPGWVSAHLATGLIFLAVLILMHLRFKRWGAGLSELGKIPRPTNQLYILIAAITLLVYLQAVMGGVVSSSGAGLACPDFPTCFGKWIPPFGPLVSLQFMHRVLALMVFISVSGFLIMTIVTKMDARIRRAANWIFMLTMVQIILGIGNVVFMLPKVLSIAHLAFATVLFALLINLTYKVKHARLS